MKRGATLAVVADHPRLQVEYRPLATLTPYARNARTHSLEQVQQIAASMREFGWTNPVLIDEWGGIIAGHGRVMAAESMGMQEAPTITLRGLTPAQRQAYVLADNKIALNAGWDEALLAAELRALREDDFDLEVIGFSDAELDDLLLGDGTPPGSADGGGATAIPLVSQPGDMWLLGPHRLRCGSATVAEDVTALMGEDRADCLWTDPPYNVDYEGVAGKILNDKMSADAFSKLLRDALGAAASVMKQGAAAYVAHADIEGLAFRSAFVAAGFKLSGCLIWRKPALVLGRADYQWRHESILYGWKPGAPHSWFGGRARTTMLELDDPPVTKTGDDEYQINLGEETLVIRGAGITVERVVGSLLYEEKPSRNIDHPTMKPVRLIERMLRNSTERGAVVLDLFGGGGSTLIACHQTSRRARLMELDPKFVDSTVRRWQDLTGLAATHAVTGAAFDKVAAKHQAG